MPYTNFVPVIGTISSVMQGTDCCSQTISLRTENGTVNFVVMADTLIIDNRQLRRGMRVAAFYDSSLPVPLIFPPQYQAQIVTMLMREEQVMLNRFDRNLVAVDNSLRLNVDRNMSIRTANGQEFNCRLANRTLLVYYTVTTRSIPPQTTPRKIVVFC